MKIILDEGVPEELEQHLTGHVVSNVRRERWASIPNGALLDLIELARFEAFITNDKRMQHEQELGRRPFACLLLSTNHWPTMRAHLEKIKAALNQAKRGAVVKVDCGIFVPRRFRSPRV